MSWTKNQFIIGAFEELGVADYEFDVQPAEKQSALRRLDSMMAEWNAEGLRLGYPLPAKPSDSRLADLTEVPDSANQAVYTNLALRLSPMIGKPITRDLKTTAYTALNVILLRSGSQQPTTRQLPSTMPRGAGHKTYRNQGTTFFPTPRDPVDAGPDSVLDYN